MLDVSTTGNGLNIIIKCEYIPHHDWMTFASWYSIYKNLPDAEVKLVCHRIPSTHQLFHWPDKCSVKHIFWGGTIEDYPVPENSLVITPEVMAVSHYDVNKLGPIDVKSEENFTFVSYFNGCGKFVMNEWINKTYNPFGVTDRLFTDDISLNEYRVLKMWEKAKTLHTVVG